MTTLYLTEPRALLRKDGDTLTVHIPADPAQKREAQKKSVPLLKIDQVVVFGDATLTSPAIAALLEQRAEICFLSAYGRWRGRLSPEMSKNVLLRIEQHKAHHDVQKRFGLARSFVLGKLSNMRVLLLRANRKRNHPSIEDATTRIKATIEQITQMDAQTVSAPPDPARPQADSAEGVLQGLEGAASAAYFEGFAHTLSAGWTFERRVRRPPTDPINALLSYAYTLLYHQVQAAINIVGLEPYVGYLHSSQYGKPALALDLMEEFRPLIADSVVLTLTNNAMLNADTDFAVEETGAYRLSDTARRTFLEKFEERLRTEVQHPTFGYKVSYRRCLEMQARLLAKALTGEIPAYVPFSVR